jgi:hypothetical protein
MEGQRDTIIDLKRFEGMDWINLARVSGISEPSDCVTAVDENGRIIVLCSR